MRYGNSSAAWGIGTCSGSWSYAGASECSACPIDPLDGARGNWNDTNTSPLGCWKATSTATGLNIGLNAQTTGTANCYWNGTNYALGGSNTHGCDAYNVTACAAGYYSADPTNYWGSPCTQVESGYYSPDGDVGRTACTTLGADYTASDGGRSEAGNCYKSCTRACDRPACPANATCSYGTETTSGTEYYGGSCSAAASACTMTVTCNPGYYKNSNGTCTACEDGYFCPGNNVRTACTTLGAAYTKSDGARSANTNCYQSCSKACTQQACATGVNACTHANTATTGTQHYQGTCNAAASNCAQTVTNCASGYYKNGNACAACSALGDKTYGSSANANSSGSGVCYKSCGNSSVSNGYIPPNASTVYYPTGCGYNSANTVCDSGYNLTADNVCAAMCAAGVTKIRTGDLIIPLYASKQTAPAIHVNVGGKVCYGNLAAGAATGALNVNIDGNKYHAVH